MLRTSTTHATDIEGVIVHLSGTAGMADLDQFSMLLDSIAAAAPPRGASSWTLRGSSC